MRAAGLLIALLIGAGVVAAQPPAPPPKEPSFQDQVGPLLTTHCLRCHSGPKPKGNLDLTTADGMLKGGKTGAVLTPGQAAASRLFQRVLAREMPPRQPLAEADVRLLRAWIDAGARWQGPALKPPRPEQQRAGTDWWSLQPIRRPPLPTVAAATWVRNPLDAFILARLEAQHLHPAPEADRRTYIRRVTLDLLGLPPTPEEVAAFVADSSPDAYERLVDRLLALPHYGERWGRHWLDVVRFAESSGYENNVPRLNAWPYRDYVIRAFNEDRSYDRFVREQLAGDAVAEDDPLTAAATGFLVCGPTDLNVTQVPAARLMQRLNDLDDMVSTTSAAFLGLTVNCARCHDHKFDPITQQDYYGLHAVFDGVRHGERPLLDGAGRERRREEEKLRAELATLYCQLDAIEPLAGERSAPPGRRPPVNAWRNVERFTPVEAKYVRLRIAATVKGDRPGIDEFEVWSAEPAPRNLALADAGAKESASPEGGERYRIWHLTDGRFGDEHAWVSGAPGSGWVQVELPRSAAIDRVVWGRDRTRKVVNGVAGDYVVEVSSDGKSWQTVAGSWDRLAPGQPLAAEMEKARAAQKELWDQVQQREARLAQVLDGPAIHAGTFRLAGRTHVLRTGDPLLPEQEVGPSAIALVGRRLAADAATPEQQRRLALADWIADEHNPLPDRVAVNRLWHYHFGQGLVRTPSDFGFNGDRPSHPELLDWLASEFRAQGRRFKPLHRLIVLSAAYRQSSRPDPAAQALDGDDRLLWRYPPRRVEAEVIRDSVLQVSGSLETRMGGPGYDLWEHSQKAVVQYTPKDDPGPETFRRMVYQFRPRIHQDSTFGAFDCPDASLPAPRRTISTTPLQALNLLNSRFIEGQSERFAERLSREAGPEAAAQVRWAFLLCFGREPAPAEQAAAVQLVQTYGLKVLCRTLFNTNEFVFIP